MVNRDDITSVINETNQLYLENKLDQKESEYWSDNAAKVLIFVDDLMIKSESVNCWIPKNLNKGNANFSIIELMFTILDNVTNANIPFENTLWSEHLQMLASQEFGAQDTSLYELMYSRFCSLFTQMLGDRFPYVQKILIKNLFSTSPVRSVMASDLYVFLMRPLSKHQRTAMCQIVMNMCKLAPPEALVPGVSLINRIGHPFINFESPLHQSILAKFSTD